MNSEQDQLAKTALAFKAFEIEERADVYFFRPVGMLLARVARALRLTPTAVTLLAAAAGIAGGVMLRSPGLGVAAFVLLITHGVLDSSDGQLARMTGHVSELGRVLDGLSGYLTHVAIYVAIISMALARTTSGATIALAFLAAVANVAQALMYDYHRCAYMAYAIDGVVPAIEKAPASGFLACYQAFQRGLAGYHPGVEQAIARRGQSGRVRDDDRERYRACFYAPVRGWNLMGDNTRFFAIGVLLLMHRLEWFPMFILLPMNVVFVALWLWQARRDRGFLASL